MPKLVLIDIFLCSRFNVRVRVWRARNGEFEKREERRIEGKSKREINADTRKKEKYKTQDTMQVYVEGLGRERIDVYRRQVIQLLVVGLLFLLAETLQELHPLQRV